MESHIILSPDGLTLDETVRIVECIGPRLYAVKAHNLIDGYSEQAIAQLRDAGAPRIWVDYKLHDIPSTHGNRASELINIGADIITVHASADVDALKATKEVSADVLVYAVTLLTSLKDERIMHIYNRSREEQVLVLARIALEAGIDGIVCSPLEVGLIRREPGFESIPLIVPGIRSQDKNVHDQQRVDTPENAIRNGATRLVIGRQICGTKKEPVLDHFAALEEIEAEIAKALPT